MSKRIRSQDLAQLHTGLSAITKHTNIGVALGAAAKNSRLAFAAAEGREADEYDPIPIIGYAHAYSALTSVAGIMEIGDNLSQIESWLYYRWLNVPVLYKPHPYLVDALMKSDPPNVIEASVLKRLHGGTWAAVIPAGTACSDYRYLIGGVTSARFRGETQYKDAIATAALHYGNFGSFRQATNPSYVYYTSAEDFRGAEQNSSYDTDDELSVSMAARNLILNLGLYLASEEPDIDLPKWHPAAHAAVKASTPADRPIVVGVGGKVGPRIGAALHIGERSTPGPSLGGTHASPITHFRRGHWRHSWIGPKTDDKPGTERVIHWIAPTVVGKGDPAPTQRDLR